MKVKVGDNVKILAGKDKGKEGKIIKTLKNKDKVVVEGINMVKKHVKPRGMNEVGSIVDVEAPIHVSNVKLIDNNTKKAKDVKASKKEIIENKEDKEDIDINEKNDNNENKEKNENIENKENVDNIENKENNKNI